MASREHIRVLVVDDDSIVCKTVQAILDSEGYNVRAFTQASKALTSASRNDFQIAIVDIKMPEMNGEEVIRRLKSIDDTISPIIMTAYPDVDNAAEVMRDGARDYIPKPFRQEQLLAAVNRVCQEKGLVYANEGDLNSLVGGRIRGHRQSLNLTLRELSSRTNLTTSQLSQVELGKNAASLWALARISAALRTNMSELLQDL
jgi:DNA-binding NtrC family response regulator